MQYYIVIFPFQMEEHEVIPENFVSVTHDYEQAYSNDYQESVPFSHPQFSCGMPNQLSNVDLFSQPNFQAGGAMKFFTPRGRPKGTSASRIKGAMSAYACFVRKSYKDHQELHSGEDFKFGELSAQCSQKWKTMSDQEKQQFHEMAMKDRERYKFEMKDYVGVRRRRRRRARKDPSRPKRALSAFFFFAKDFRSDVKQSNPDFSVGEIAKELGRRWSTLSDEAKAPYEKQSEDDKVRYWRAMELYNSGALKFQPEPLHSGSEHSMVFPQQFLKQEVKEEVFGDYQPLYS